ncbi:acetyl/propionyl-CoA carboxylase subunit alpha [Planctomonas sp. JC2975]|uniref:ATP-binding protein n=1 Tax=Planctomonas sp. JC2975 TaxID=2729626 RepID=UPI001472D8AB|nr:biotin carboxylase N-terminal domain-containing protein [Planctomonas sp. JC2975]NNC13333.1 acetyl/propionyl-CoA carboxylase subunit alpha [Planctomonas sp. JC2975]
MSESRFDTTPARDSTPVFSTVLVANRGEIACRVIRTLRSMGIRSVAVYSDADAGARHVREADEAVRIGPADAARSYLDIDAVLGAARRTGAQAIHPGYGFLSENPAFAAACDDAGIVFIGPSASAIEAMGDKVRAKRLVADHGVPVTPGVDDRSLDDGALAAAAERLGLPVLVKPSAGGGGMGMAEVREASELPAALRTARRIALAAFGDDALFVERLIETPRHIEVQVLADAHGHVVHLGERECSLQRRHQKVVEECPSPAVSADLRARLGSAACDVARSVGYTGAGTVEFLVSASDPNTFYFMEMNTRLQVEHPVTELVCRIQQQDDAPERRIDLVEQQVRIAAGEALAFEQGDVGLDGHAVEVRVYAEDPARGFLPATGTILVLHEPEGEGIRVDSALLPQLAVTDAYDPMLAKVIAWGSDRDEAFRRLSAALREATVLGVRTNLRFLLDLIDHGDVRAGRLDTGLIARMLDAAQERSSRSSGTEVETDPFESRSLDRDAPRAAALLLHDDAWNTGSDAPWSRPNAWRIGGQQPVHYVFRSGDETVDVALHGTPAAATVTVGTSPRVRVSILDRSGHDLLVELDGLSRRFRTARDGDTVWLAAEGSTWVLRMLPPVRSAAERGTAASASGAAADSRVRAPMPGTVVAVDISDGETVEEGAGLLVIEAMKMEHRLTAPHAGVVRLAVGVGDRVASEQVLASVDATAGPDAQDLGASGTGNSETRVSGGSAPETGDQAISASAQTQGGTLAADSSRTILTTEGPS